MNSNLNNMDNEYNVRTKSPISLSTLVGPMGDDTHHNITVTVMANYNGISPTSLVDLEDENAFFAMKDAATGEEIVPMDPSSFFPTLEKFVLDWIIAEDAARSRKSMDYITFMCYERQLLGEI